MQRWKLHRILGPGFLEAVYEAALAYELKLRGVRYARQVHLPVTYKGQPVGDYVADLVIDDKIILELKAVSHIHDVHRAQAHPHLAATGLRLAIILNFGAQSLEHERIIR